MLNRLFNQKPKIGEFYYHFKHDVNNIFDHAYIIVGFGFDAEKDCEVLFYQPLYEMELLKKGDMTCFVRSIPNFTGKVSRDGKIHKRFSKIKDKEIIEKLKIKEKEMYG